MSILRRVIRNNQRRTYTTAKAQPSKPLPTPTGLDALKGLAVVGLIVGGIMLVNHHATEEYPDNNHAVHITNADRTHLSTVTTYGMTSIAWTPNVK